MINVTHLDHPKTIALPESMEKYSTKPVPVLKNIGDPWIKPKMLLSLPTPSSFSDLEAGQVQGLQVCGVQPNNHFTI